MYPKKEYRFGFHKIPSIYHLHMHCLVLPFLNEYFDKIYYGDEEFITVDDVLE